MTTKIVVDTSIFVSALIGSLGPSRELIRCCLKGEYQPLMGNALFCEYESVINREEILPHTKGLKPLPKGVNLDVEYIQLKLLKEPQEDAK